MITLLLALAQANVFTDKMHALHTKFSAHMSNAHAAVSKKMAEHHLNEAHAQLENMVEAVEKEENTPWPQLRAQIAKIKQDIATYSHDYQLTYNKEPGSTTRLLARADAALKKLEELEKNKQ
jgi:hypothetical protein